MADQERRPAPAELAVDHDQPAPGREADMQLKPDSNLSNYKAADKLVGKVALVTGGDSGIGRAVAIAYAMEGADVAIAYNHSEEDAAQTCRIIEQHGKRCLSLLADVTVQADRERLVQETVAPTFWLTMQPTLKVMAHCRSSKKRVCVASLTPTSLPIC